MPQSRPPPVAPPERARRRQRALPLAQPSQKDKHAGCIDQLITIGAKRTRKYVGACKLASKATQPQRMQANQCPGFHTDTVG